MEPQHLWLYFGIALLIGEIITPGFFISIFSIGALVASLFSYFDHGLKTQLIAFLSTNIVCFIYLRPLLLKLLYKNQTMKKTNIDSYIGKEGIVTESINNIENKGRIKISGESWLAKSISDKKIETGDCVSILNRKGNTFYVSKIKTEDN